MKRFKFLLIAVIVATLTITGLCGVTYAQSLNYDECDRVFLQTLEETASESGYNHEKVSINKQIVYDIDLHEFGLLYDFKIAGDQGFAFLLYSEGIVEVAEMYYGAVNPYADLDGVKPIYLSNSNYAYEKDGEFYFVKDNELIDEDNMNEIKESAFYSGGTPYSAFIETITYTQKTESKNELAKRSPSIISTNGQSATWCAPIAGSNIVQYFDRYSENLIANYTPGSSVGQFYLYKTQGSETDIVTNQLYSMMGTDSINPGTSVTQFKNGLTNYNSGKGYSTTYTSSMSSGNFDFNSAKSLLDAGKPIALFVRDFTLVKITSTTDKDTATGERTVYMHTMAGFGYKDITYTLPDNTIKVSKYIAVASGISTFSSGFMNVDYSIVDDAYGVYIN